MAFKIDNDANITMVQGDSGTIVVDGLSTDKNYTVYFAVKDKKRNTIGNEIMVQSNNASSVIFYLTGEYTDAFVVPKGANYAVYYYGIKICDSENNIEDTLLLGFSGEIGDINTITVYPKKVEGVKL